LTCTNIRCKVYPNVSPIGCPRHSLTIFNSSLSFYTFILSLFHSFRAVLPKRETLQSCTTSRLSCCLRPSHRRAPPPVPVLSNPTGNVCFSPTKQQKHFDADFSTTQAAAKTSMAAQLVLQAGPASIPTRGTHSAFPHPRLLQLPRLAQHLPQPPLTAHP
jgi:hypothetical protein